MKHKIDPLVDCVFKALLGAEKNRNLLIHFLNAVTGFQGDRTITEVEITNPFNEKKFFDGKYSVVDIKAKCQNGYRYQIEVQLACHQALENRILYNWSSIYHADLKKGEIYAKLKPTISIWVLNEPLFPQTPAYHLLFQPYDPVNHLLLSDHMNIHLLQLPKFEVTETVNDEMERWLYFFRRAGYLKTAEELPQVLQTQEMRQAMETLIDFSEDEERYLLYQSRLDALCKEKTLDNELKELQEQLGISREQLGIAREEQQDAREKQRAAEEKLEAILQHLKEKGIDPNAL